MAAAAAAADPGAQTCSKPNLPDRQVQAQEVKTILQVSQAYIDCISKEIENERGKATSMVEAAHIQVEKSNKMVEDANTFIKNVKAFQAEHAGN